MKGRALMSARRLWLATITVGALLLPTSGALAADEPSDKDLVGIARSTTSREDAEQLARQELGKAVDGALREAMKGLLKTPVKSGLERIFKSYYRAVYKAARGWQPTGGRLMYRPPAKTGGYHEVVLAVPRKEAAKAVMKEAAAAQGDYANALTEAGVAAASSERKALAEAWARLFPLAVAREAAALRHAAALDTSDSGGRKARAQELSAVMAAVDKTRRSVKMDVVPESQGLRGITLAEALVGALRAAGVGARATKPGEQCRDKANGFEILVSGSMRCKEKGGLHRCDLDLKLEGKACSGEGGSLRSRLRATGSDLGGRAQAEAVAAKQLRKTARAKLFLLLSPHIPML
jgi:hypothetical protein